MASVVAIAMVCFAGCVDSAGLSDATCPAVCNGVCIDLQNDSAHCGACGNVCPTGQSCSMGQCGAAPAPAACGADTTLCGSACVDTKVDPANCGGCGAACAATETCKAGACACPTAAPDACGTGAAKVCTSLQQDASNCGSCGNACPAPLTCVAGKCAQTAATKSLSLLAGQLGSWGNQDGTGSGARFNYPWGGCWDGGANLYVADSGNCVIRKIALATGATTTFAGTMNSCATLDGVGPAARFNAPTSCAIDGAGGLYVADRSGTCSIRKIDIATGAVSTIAGAVCGYSDGIGSAAKFSSPQGLAYDGTAYLYVSDSGNHAVRRLELSSGTVTTIAGALPPTAAFGSTDDVGGLARFNGPQGLYVDSGAGYLYVTDYNNHTLRRVEISSGTVSTVVGLAATAGATNGMGTAARLRNPIGVAGDGANNLYIVEDGNHDVRAVSLTDFSVSTNAGAAVAGYADGTGTGALFVNPRAITFDGSGNYYVVEYGGQIVRKVAAATGAVTTLAGLGAAFGATNGTGDAARFNYPWGLAYDAGSNTLYLSDYNTHTIRAVNAATGAVTTLAGTAGLTGNVDGTGAAAHFTNPAGIVLDGRGALYVADRSNQTIRKVIVATGEVTTIAGSAGTPGYKDDTGTSILFNAPTAIAFDGGTPGKLYIGDYNNHVVRQLDLATGTSTTPAGVYNVSAVVDGVGANARFSNITGVATKGDGKVYVADTNRIRVLDVASSSVVTLSGGGGYSDGRGVLANFSFNTQPGQLVFDGAGNLLLADYNNQTIRTFNPTTLHSATVVGIYGDYGGVPGLLPTPITTSPRAAVAIPGGWAFAANYGVFVVR